MSLVDPTGGIDLALKLTVNSQADPIVYKQEDISEIQRP
jgi:hypothetical protein